jgi:hypothetical protein
MAIQIVQWVLSLLANSDAACFETNKLPRLWMAVKPCAGVLARSHAR